MEKQRFVLAVLIPLAAIILVAALAISLGIAFTALEHGPGEIGVIILGVLIVVLVPVAAFLIERKIDPTN
tara:strand:- start:241 stop:450 length:210 start_codon:yes stop_codon:yes gene_type:complete